MASPIDYIREFRARRGYVHDMVHPRRHRNLLIRALWWKQERRQAAKTMADSYRPSEVWDVAYEDYTTSDAMWAECIREAWKNRSLERPVRHEPLTAPVVAGAVRLSDAVREAQMEGAA